MTLQLRPTFSESWYRVKTLKVRLRPSAQISRQYYRGERWYVVRDPAGNQFHRLSDPAYRFVGLLDGSRTVEEAWDLAGGQLADDAPTQPEVIQILSHLFSANLIDADITPDANVLLRRHKKLQSRKLQGRLMNALFPRIPLWDPDRFLKLWMPVVRLMFSKLGAIVWLIVMALAIITVAPMSADLKKAAANSISPGNWLYLWAVFVFVKLIHELGHAFSCRRFGGECHELGIMFLVFIPTPYVDASTAWAFPNKWHRMFVGAAGMIVELFFAALLTFIWAFTNKDGLLSQLMFNAMLVASVSTLVFNANPLLRYDGYYILSDLLEIPNLRQKSSEYGLGLIKRHLFRVKLQQPLPPLLQRFWLLSYSIASSIYRVLVGFAIMMMVLFQIPVLGVLMAIGGLATWLLVPVFKTFKYLALDPELHRKRGRAIAFSSAFAVAIVIVIGLIQFPLKIDQEGVIEPVQKVTLRAESPGFIRKVGNNSQGRPLRDGDFVTKGTVLFVCEDKTIESKVEELSARVKAVQAELAESTALDPLKRLIDIEALDVARKQLAQYVKRQGALVIKAPIDGYLWAPDIQQMIDRHLAEGQEVATVADLSKMEVITLLEQRDSQQVLAKMTPGSQPGGAISHSTANIDVEVRPAGQLGLVLAAADIENRGTDTSNKVPKPLTEPFGGTVRVDPKDPSGTTPLMQQYEVRVKLPEPAWNRVAVDTLTLSKETKSLLMTSGVTTLGAMESLRDRDWMQPMVQGLDDSRRKEVEGVMFAYWNDHPLERRLSAGQRAHVRFKLDKQPLLEQWGRRFWQLVQERSATANPKAM